MPIMATVMAVRAAKGLIACNPMLEDDKKTIKNAKENKIIAVPMTKFLWLIFSDLLTVFIICFDLMLSFGTGCSKIRTTHSLLKLKIKI